MVTFKWHVGIYRYQNILSNWQTKTIIGTE